MVLKYIFGLILILSVFALVWIGKADAQVYVGLVTATLGAAGMYHATAWQPRLPRPPASAPTPPSPPAPIQDQPVVRSNPVEDAQNTGAAGAAARLNAGG